MLLYFIAFVYENNVIKFNIEAIFFIQFFLQIKLEDLDVETKCNWRKYKIQGKDKNKLYLILN